MSVIWTLRKYVDSIAHREEEAAQRRDRRMASLQHTGDNTDSDGATPVVPPKTYRCRVCELQSTQQAYCPQCLADTMEEVDPTSVS